MTDKREDILLRLNAVMASLLDTPDYAFRNAGEVPETARPAIVVLDADEELDTKLDPYGKGRPSAQIIPVVLKPEIFVLVQETDDQIGPKINEWRAKVIKAVMLDSALIGLCHEIRYDGFTSAFANGRSMEGQAKVHFSFVYMLRPDQL